jgi:hypothetical protein
MQLSALKFGLVDESIPPEIVEMGPKWGQTRLAAALAKLSSSESNVVAMSSSSSSNRPGTFTLCALSPAMRGVLLPVRPYILFRRIRRADARRQRGRGCGRTVNGARVPRSIVSTDCCGIFVVAGQGRRSSPAREQRRWRRRLSAKTVFARRERCFALRLTVTTFVPRPVRVKPSTFA